MAKAKSIVVTVTDEKLKDIQSVADTLAEKGMKVEQVLAVTGVITGQCAPTKARALKAVEGVLSVEDDLPVEIPEKKGSSES